MNRSNTVQESTRKRRRWGCTCGCLFVFLCLVLAITGIAVYIFRGQDPTPKERWLLPSTVGFAVIRVDPSDSGINDMIRYQVRQFEKEEGPGMSEQDRKNLHALVTAVQQFVTGFIHRDVYWFLYKDEGTEQPQWLCVVQFRRLASYLLVRAMLDSTGQPPSEKSGDARLFLSTRTDNSSHTCFGFSRKYMVFASSQETLRRGIASETAGKDEALPPESVMQYIDELSVEQPQEGEDIAGVAVNTNGQLESLIGLMASALSLHDIEQQLSESLKEAKMDMTDLRAMSLAGDVQSADKARLTFSLHCRQPSLAKKLADTMKRKLVPQLNATPQGTSGVSAKAEVRQKESRAVLSVEISGLKEIGKPPAEAKP